MGLGSFLSGGGGFLLGGASSLLGSVIGANKQEDINNANISNNWKMWNATNEYNSPINTINRYKEAGLNPALMYGNVSPGYASNMNMAVQHAPNIDLSGVGDAIGNALNYSQREKQIEIADKNAETMLLNAKKDVDLKNSQLEHQKILNDREAALNGYSGVKGYKSNGYVPPEAKFEFGNKLVSFKAPFNAVRNWFTGSGESTVPPEVQIKAADFNSLAGKKKKGGFFKWKR